VSRVLSDAVRILISVNSTHYLVRTVVSEFAELMVMVTFIYQAVVLCFNLIIWCLFVVTWLEGKNKYMDLLMIKQIS